jgi:signal transduction histidine kinase
MAAAPTSITVGAMRAAIGRIRGLLRADRARADWMLALAFAVPSVVQVAISSIGSPLSSIAIALGSTLPVAWRRSYPAIAAVAGTLPWLIPADSFLVLGYVVAFVLFYSLARWEDDPRAFAAGAAIGVAVGMCGTAINGGVFADYAGALTVLLGALGIGRFVRFERHRTDQLRDLTLHLERARERGARLAVAEERARIARELHDAVSHALSVIAIQADAAETALQRDPELASAPMSAIRSSAAEALDEMRRLLGVLREDGDGASLAPLPGIDAIPALVDRARETGMRVTLELAGEARPVPVSVGLSAYRIVQEALTNARKYARGATVTVSVRWAPDSVCVEVVDDGPGTAPNNAADDGGHGIVGMRERVRMHGGTLRAEPAAAGGFVVAAELPTEPAHTMLVGDPR